IAPAWKRPVSCVSSGLKSSSARARPCPAETNRVPCASIIVPRAHALIFWANSSGVTSLPLAKVAVDVTPARLAQEQAQERGRERQGRAGGERPCVRLERVDARPARDGPRPTRSEEHT